jgi:hypothetical protein
MLFLPEERAGEAGEYSENTAIPETGTIGQGSNGTFFIHALLRRDFQRFHNTTANLVLFLNTEKDLN